MRRVIQFSTGNVGRHSLRAIIGGPDLELVGVHAASSEKIGRDAAELCGLDQPTGIFATDDVDALVDVGADCVVYTSQGETRPMEAIDQIANFLAAGNQRRRKLNGLAGRSSPCRRLVAGAVGARLRGPATPPSTSTESTRASLAIHWSIEHVSRSMW
jgi:hypothetical protein